MFDLSRASAINAITNSEAKIGVRIMESKEPMYSFINQMTLYMINWINKNSKTDSLKFGGGSFKG